MLGRLICRPGAVCVADTLDVQVLPAQALFGKKQAKRAA